MALGSEISANASDDDVRDKPPQDVPMDRNRILAILVALIVIGALVYFGSIHTKKSLTKQDASITRQLNTFADLTRDRAALATELATELAKHVPESENVELFDALKTASDRIAAVEDPKELALVNIELNELFEDAFKVVKGVEALQDDAKMKELTEKISKAARQSSTAEKFYDQKAAQFNKAIVQFPGFIFAEKLGLSPRPVINEEAVDVEEGNAEKPADDVDEPKGTSNDDAEGESAEFNEELEI